MTSRLLLEKEREDSTSGMVKPLYVVNGSIYQGLSVGTWHIGGDAKVYIDLKEDIDIIIHEVATRKSVRAELRAAEKDNRGVEVKPVIQYDPVTRRFKQV